MDRVAARVVASGPKWCAPTERAVRTPPLPTPHIKPRGSDRTILKNYLAAMSRTQRDRWGMIVAPVKGWPMAMSMRAAAARLVLGYHIRPKEDKLLARLNQLAQS